MMSRKVALDAYSFLLSYIRTTSNFLAYYYMYHNINPGMKAFQEHAEKSAFFDMMVIAWCRLFGNEQTNHTHWKNIFNNDNLVIGCNLIRVKTIADFKNKMLIKAQVSNEEFEILWIKMKNYRNKFVAHHDLTTIKKAYDPAYVSKISLGIIEFPDLPNIEIAKKIILAFYSVMGEISYKMMSKGLVINHYIPAWMHDEIMAELAANKHRKKWRNRKH